ncbi:MAG: hypothetical protein ABSC11_02125 [Smithella sp.]
MSKLNCSLDDIYKEIAELLIKKFGDDAANILLTTTLLKSPLKDAATAKRIELLLNIKLTHFDKCAIDNLRNAHRHYILCRRALTGVLASYQGREEKKNGK